MSRNILIVDDSAVMQAVIARCLHMAGLPEENVHTAPGAQEALDFLDKQPVDLIIADTCMPGMSGSQFVATVHKNQALSAVPIIALSPDLSTPRDQALMERGVRICLRKPFTPEALNAALNEVLGECDAADGQ